MVHNQLKMLLNLWNKLSMDKYLSEVADLLKYIDDSTKEIENEMDLKFSFDENQ